jgi:hypothetical protein
MDAINSAVRRREPWNKGKLVGQKAAFEDRLSSAKNGRFAWD